MPGSALAGGANELDDLDGAAIGRRRRRLVDDVERRRAARADGHRVERGGDEVAGRRFRLDHAVGPWRQVDEEQLPVLVGAGRARVVFDDVEAAAGQRRPVGIELADEDAAKAEHILHLDVNRLVLQDLDGEVGRGLEVGGGPPRLAQGVLPRRDALDEDDAVVFTVVGVAGRRDELPIAVDESEAGAGQRAPVRVDFEDAHVAGNLGPLGEDVDDGRLGPLAGGDGDFLVGGGDVAGWRLRLAQDVRGGASPCPAG